MSLTLLFLAGEGWLLRIPSQRDYGEGHVLWMTQQIPDAGRAYQPIDALPYVVYPYPPLYMLLSRLVNFFCKNLLMAGRGGSLFCGFGIGVVVALTILFSTPTRAPLLWRLASAAFGGVLPLIVDSVAGWAPLMRVDMLALFLMYSGLCVYVMGRTRELRLYAAASLFVLALFTKQTMLSAPLACLIFGLLVDRRRAIRVCACAVAVTLAVALFLNAVTQGGLLRHVLAYNINPFSWKAACHQLYVHARTSLPWALTAAVCFLGIWNPVAIRQRGWRRFLQARSADPYRRAVIVAGLNCAFAAVSMLTIGKVGASYNHVMDWDISVCLLCGLFLFRVLASWTSGGKGRRTAALACALLPLSLLLPSTTLLGAVLHEPAVLGPMRGEDAVLRIMRRTPGPVFSENLLLLMQAGKQVEVEPATITFLARAGSRDERPYVALFDRQHFSLLVAYDIRNMERFTPAVTSAIERAYVLERRLGAYLIYRPVPRSAPRSQGQSPEF